MRVRREIDAEEHDDQSGAEHTEDGHGNRRGAGGDAPLAHEVPEKLNEIDVLKKRGVLDEARKLGRERRGAYGDTLRKKRDLPGKRRPGGPYGERKTDRHGQRHNGKRNQPGQAGDFAEGMACPVKHDGEENAGEGEQDRRLRVPESEGGSDDRERRRGDLRGLARAHGLRRDRGGGGGQGAARLGLAWHGGLALLVSARS